MTPTEVFSCHFFETFQDSIFLRHMCMAVSDLSKYLKTLTMNCELDGCLTTLTIIIDFTEYIWNSGVAMKQL